MKLSSKYVATLLSTTVAFSLVACSNDSGSSDSDVPSFTTEKTSTEETSTSETTSSESATSSSSSTTKSATSTTSASKFAGKSVDTKDEDNPRSNGDGSYKLTLDEVGPGVVETQGANFRNLKEQGFKDLGIRVLEPGQNGVMQFPVGAELEIVAAANNWSGDRLRDEFASWDIKILNENGDNAIDSVNDVKHDYTNNTVAGDVFGDLPGAQVVYKQSVRAIVNLPEAGEYTLHAEFRQPGYEPFVIKQKMLVVD